MIFLENAHIKASFSTKGAELQRLESKETGIKYLWNGDKAYWPKFSPVLFPIVGGLKDNTYHLEGQSYQLPRHGFARDNGFESDSVNDSEIFFYLKHDQQTLKVYPFEFTLGIRYKISGPSISCTYEVLNTGNKPLLFSIGAHPAFAVPLEEGLNYDDYYLQFNKDTELVYNKISNDLIADETEKITLNSGSLALKHELFYKDALVLKSLKSDCISLKSAKSPHGLDFRFKDFPFFGIWAAKDANFVCLEPWCGIADGVHHNQDLKTKEGINTLEAGETWSRSWEVSCF